MTPRRLLIESARQLLTEARSLSGDEDEGWAVRNALLSLSILKAVNQPRERIEMKRPISTALFLIAALFMLTGCKTPPSPMTRGAVTAAVAFGASFGVEQYPDAMPELEIARSVICASAHSTNVMPNEIVEALDATGVHNEHSILIINGSLAVYNAVFSYYGTDWVNQRPALQGYLSAVCDGLIEAIPPRQRLNSLTLKLPDHLQ